MCQGRQALVVTQRNLGPKKGLERKGRKKICGGVQIQAVRMVNHIAKIAKPLVSVTEMVDSDIPNGLVARKVSETLSARSRCYCMKRTDLRGNVHFRC